MTIIKGDCGSTYKVSDFPLQCIHSSDVTPDKSIFGRNSSSLLNTPPIIYHTSKEVRNLIMLVLVLLNFLNHRSINVLPTHITLNTRLELRGFAESSADALLHTTSLFTNSLEEANGGTGQYLVKYCTRCI